MILVFIILGIIIFSCILILILIGSNIKFEIKKLHITNESNVTEIYFVFDIALYLLERYKIAKITVDNDKIKDLLKKGKINIKRIKDSKRINKESLKIIKKVKFNIEYLKLEGEFATIDGVCSVVIFTLIQSVIPIIIASKINGKYINKIQFININKNMININTECIISIKMVNIINIFSEFIKKGGIRDNGKSSNRRSYAYCNE